MTMNLSDTALHLPILDLPDVTMTTLHHRVPRPATAIWCSHRGLRDDEVKFLLGGHGVRSL